MPALETTVEVVEAMNSRCDGIGRGVLLTHVAFDDQHIAVAGKGTVQSAVRKINDGRLPSRRKQMACDSAADALCPPP